MVALRLATVALGLVAITAPASSRAAEGGTDLASRYVRAESLLDAKLVPLALNERIEPHWVGTGSTFWYRRARKDGADYVLADGSGARGPAFDADRLAAAANAAGAKAAPAALEVTALEPGRSATLAAGSRTLTCSLADYTCADAPAVVRDTRALASPDGRRLLLAHDDDLWIRDAASGRETRLTSDGAPGFSWGRYPDAGLLGLVAQRHPLPFPPWGFTWSPDGRWLVGGRVDERPIPAYPFLESAPQDGSFRPVVRTIHSALLGEPQPAFTACVFDAATGARTPLRLPPDGSLNAIEPLGWSRDGARFTFVWLGAGGRELSLLEATVATGAVRRVFSERPQGFVNTNSSLYNAPNIRLIKGGSQIIWFSERSGFGHLYRYDIASGRLLNAVTQGDWLVRDIVHVDEAHGRLFFTASGQDAADPYRRRLYRVNFDGTGLTLLTPEAADHMVEGEPAKVLQMLYGNAPPAPPVSPDGSVFIDSASKVSQPGSPTLRRTSDGAVVARLETADVSGLDALGWRPPEPFTAKAADGATDLHGVIYWPDAAAGAKVPVIDALYGGPQDPVVPHNHPGALMTYPAHGRSALAVLGFAVVSIDGRGTPQRSHAFQNAGFANFGDVALADHVAVLKALGSRYPRLDLDRVGVYGHSFGGYVSARAMLRYPQVYKAAVSSAGSHRYQSLYGAGYTAPPDYGGGQPSKPSATAVPAPYAEMDNATLAANLKGHLLLAYGDLDENAYPAGVLQLVDALTKADRRYDLLYMPNRPHGFARDPYFVHRLWDYFVVHLMGAEPPPPPASGAAKP